MSGDYIASRGDLVQRFARSGISFHVHQQGQQKLLHRFMRSFIVNRCTNAHLSNSCYGGAAILDVDQLDIASEITTKTYLISPNEDSS